MNSISPQMLGLVAGDMRLVGSASPQGQPPEPTLKRLVRAAVRWRWVLIAGVAAGAVVGAAVTLLSTRQYASTERLQIARDTAQVVNVGALSREVSVGDQEFYQTQYGLLRAQALAERVARDLGVVDDPAFFRMFHKSKDFATNPGPAGRAARNGIAGEILLARIEIAPVHGSSLVDIQATTPLPALSQRIAQTWSRDFIASNLERRQAPANYASQFLEARLDQLRGRLEASEQRALDYAASQGIIDLPSGVSTGATTDAAARTPVNSKIIRGRSLVSDDLIALNTALETATADRIQAAGKLAASGAAPDASGDALEYRAIGVLREQRADAASEYAKLAAQFAPDDPSAKAAHAQVDALDAAIRAEESRVHASLQQTYQAAQAREQALDQRVNALKGAYADLRQRSIQYNIYQREADTNRELYDALLQRYKEIGVAGAVENNNVAVIDAARLPSYPSSPRLSINLLLFTLAGAVIGVIVAAILQQIGDGTLKDEPSPAGGVTNDVGAGSARSA